MKLTAREFLYPSNLLSLSRALLPIPILYFVSDTTTRGTIIVVSLIGWAVVSDVLDGWIGRRLNQVTELGKILDPLADKIVMAVGLVYLVFYRDFPFALIMLLLYRDLAIMLVGLIVSRAEGAVVSANVWGKINTAVFTLTGASFLIAPESLVTRVLFVLGYTTIAVSGIAYYFVGERYFAKTTRQRVLARAIAVLLTAAVVYTVFSFDPTRLRGYSPD